MIRLRRDHAYRQRTPCFRSALSHVLSLAQRPGSACHRPIRSPTETNSLSVRCRSTKTTQRPHNDLILYRRRSVGCHFCTLIATISICPPYVVAFISSIITRLVDSQNVPDSQLEIMEPAVVLRLPVKLADDGSVQRT